MHLRDSVSDSHSSCASYRVQLEVEVAKGNLSTSGTSDIHAFHSSEHRYAQSYTH